jgi:hypothetical protein
MSKPEYICECRECFDYDTGASEGVVECFPCAAWAGECECYTDEPCDLCVLRKTWEEERKDELTPILSVVQQKVAEHKSDLATAALPGSFSHEYLRRKLEMRLEPCLRVLEMVEDKSAWATSVIREVKEVLRLEGFTEGRPYCGLNGCNCHLARLNELKQEKMSPEMKMLDQEICAAANLRHAHREIVEERWDLLEKVRFQKRIAEEMVDEHECEAGAEYDEEREKLHATLQLKRDEQDAAESAYAAAISDANESFAKFRQLMARA